MQNHSVIRLRMDFYTRKNINKQTWRLESDNQTNWRWIVYSSESTRRQKANTRRVSWEASLFVWILILESETKRRRRRKIFSIRRNKQHSTFSIFPLHPLTTHGKPREVWFNLRFGEEICIRLKWLNGVKCFSYNIHNWCQYLPSWRESLLFFVITQTS
jgi:hypothetical protein